MLRIYADALPGLGVNRPGELHDRTAGSGEDERLHIVDVSLHAVLVPADDSDLG
jgi:hypothetical protein